VHSSGYASRTVQPVSSRCAVNAVLAFSMTVGLGKAFFFFPQIEYVWKWGRMGLLIKDLRASGHSGARTHYIFIFIQLFRCLITEIKFFIESS
jgi:hypothetical protein